MGLVPLYNPNSKNNTATNSFFLGDDVTTCILAGSTFSCISNNEPEWSTTRGPNGKRLKACEEYWDRADGSVFEEGKVPCLEAQHRLATNLGVEIRSGWPSQDRMSTKRGNLGCDVASIIWPSDVSRPTSTAAEAANQGQAGKDATSDTRQNTGFEGQITLYNFKGDGWDIACLPKSERKEEDTSLAPTKDSAQRMEWAVLINRVASGLSELSDLAEKTKFDVAGLEVMP